MKITRLSVQFIEDIDSVIKSKKLHWNKKWNKESNWTIAYTLAIPTCQTFCLWLSLLIFSDTRPSSCTSSWRRATTLTLPPGTTSSLSSECTALRWAGPSGTPSSPPTVWSQRSRGSTSGWGAYCFTANWSWSLSCWFLSKLQHISTCQAYVCTLYNCTCMHACVLKS